MDAEQRVHDGLSFNQLEEERIRWERERVRWRDEASATEKRLRAKIRELEDALRQHDLEDRHVKELLQARTDEVNNLRDHIFRRSRHDETADVQRFKDETKRVKADNAVLAERCRVVEANAAELEAKLESLMPALEEKEVTLRQLESNFTTIEKEMSRLRQASQRQTVKQVQERDAKGSGKALYHA